MDKEVRIGGGCGTKVEMVGSNALAQNPHELFLVLSRSSSCSTLAHSSFQEIASLFWFLIEQVLIFMVFCC
nr:hypothetical protein CFP56_46489 [Quercus suber]